jgi:L-malate glycosyltransferase
VDWLPAEIESMVALILEVLREKGLDILHAHYALPFAAIIAEFARRSAQATPALVVTLHGTDVSAYGRDPAVAPVLAKVLKSMDVLTTVSSSHARLAVEVFGLESAPVVIPDFVDSRRFYPGKAGSKRKKPRIGHVSNFRPIKDPEGLARIFAAVRKKLAAELWLVGNGEEMGTVTRVLKEAELDADVRFFGLCSDVAAIMRECDLLLMSSRSESFCLAALEAMACGLPVVASNVGGLTDLVQHNHTGFLFPLGDYVAAAEYTVELLSNKARYQSMSTAALARSQRFEQGPIISLYEDLYDHLCCMKSGPVGNETI